MFFYEPDHYDISPDDARRLLADRFPEAGRVYFVEHGYSNLVAIIDDTYTVRFPRTEEAFLRSQYEWHVLKALTGLTCVAIPRVLEVAERPPHVIASFVPGSHLDWRHINDLDQPSQRELGRQIASFAHELHTSLAIADINDMRRQTGIDRLPEEPWAVYFERTVLRQKFPTEEQDRLAKLHYRRWAEAAFNPDVVIHDDLHNHNLLFDGTRLSGVIDFGETHVGPPEQELRQTYRLGGTVMDAAIETYNQLSGLSLHPESIQAWAIIQELAAYSNRFFRGETDSRTFRRACYSLDSWLPEGDWSRATPAASASMPSPTGR